MRADQRAEFGPRIDQSGVRLSIGAARLFTSTALAVLGVTAVEVAQRFSGNTPAIEAAAAMCQTGARIRSVAFFDVAAVAPDAGIRHVYDRGIDIDLGAAYGFEVRAVSTDGKVRYGSVTPVKNAAGTEATGQIVFQAPCNTETINRQGKRVQGVRFGLVSSQHPENIRVVTIANGERHVENFGREVPASRQGKVSDVQRLLAEIDAGIIKPADSEKAKIDALRKWVQSQTPTATVTPTPTSTPTGTPSSTPSRTPERTGTATGTPTAPDRSPTASPTATMIRTLTITATETPTRTATSTPTATGTPPTTFGMGGIDALGTLGSVLDLPAKGIDQVTEPDTQFPVRTGIDIAGWLLAAGLLLNRPFQPRARVWNTLAWPVREVRYRIANRGVAAPPARGYPGFLGA